MKNQAAQALANLRHLSLTPERRKEIAKKAVNTRWKKLSPADVKDPLANT